MKVKRLMNCLPNRLKRESKHRSLILTMLHTACWIVCVAHSLALGASLSAQEAKSPAKDPLPHRETEWKDYRRLHFKISGREAYVVLPNESIEGKPWIWRARFPEYHAEMDIELLGRGFHIAYIDVAGLFGGPEAVRIGDAFYVFCTGQMGLSATPCLEGVSRGGLMVYNWASQNPEKLACIYCDTPVCDIKSWPGGMGKGLGHKETWQACLNVYGLTDTSVAEFEDTPIARCESIAKAKIPILHIVSEDDVVVPPQENTYLLQTRLRAFGHDMQVISVAHGTQESNGHHFQHPEPDSVVQFILQHAAGVTPN